MYKIHKPSHRFDIQNLQIFVIFGKVRLIFQIFANVAEIAAKNVIFRWNLIIFAEFCRNFTEFQQFWLSRQFYLVFRWILRKMRQLLQKICCFWQAGSLQKYPPPPGVADINLNSDAHVLVELGGRLPRDAQRLGLPEIRVLLRSRSRNAQTYTMTLSAARSRLDQRRFSRPTTHFSAFFKLYKKIIFSQANLQKFPKFHGILQTFRELFGSFNFSKKLQNFEKISQKICRILQKFCRIFAEFLQNFVKSCRFWKMLKNAILDAKICEDFAEIWQN